MTLSGGFGVTRAVWDNIPGYFNPNTEATINLNRLLAPYTPSYQGTLTLEWRRPLPGDMAVGARVSGAFTGPQWWNPTDDYSEKAYQILNAGLSLDIGKHWQLRADGSNLLDKQYHTVYAGGPDIGSPRNTAGFSRPRQCSCPQPPDSDHSWSNLSLNRTARMSVAIGMVLSLSLDCGARGTVRELPRDSPHQWT